MKSKIFLTIIVLIILIGGATYYYSSRSSTNVSEMSSEVYHNVLLKYSVPIPSGWHVSVDLSKKIDDAMYFNQLATSAGCNIQNLIKDVSTIPKKGGDAYIQQKLQDCIKDSPDFEKMKLENQEFLKIWSIENAQNVYITRLTAIDESKLNTSDLAFSWILKPKSGLVAIRGSNAPASFSDVQYKRDGYIEKMFSLVNGTKAYLTDMRGAKYPEISDTGMTLSIPISIQGKSLLGGAIQSLEIVTAAAKDSQDEKTFFSLANLIKLNQ